MAYGICWKLIHVLSTCNFIYRSNVKQIHTHTDRQTDTLKYRYEEDIQFISISSTNNQKVEYQGVPEQDRLTSIKKYIIQ